MKRILMLLVFAPLLGFSQTEEHNPCAHTERTIEVMSKYPFLWKSVKEAEKKLEDETEAYKANRGGGENEVYIIPVVFHVIHNGGPENISDEQIYSAIEGLNRDFRLLNEDVENAPDVFYDIAADIEIEFRIAQRDPEGNCTKGINRIQSTLTYDGYNDGLKELIYWPRDMYLNIWVVSDMGNTAGYTFLPSTVDGPWMEDEDGIVIRSDYTGTMGTSTNQRSRTLVHECGHWLNLLHTWGPGNGVADPDNCDWDDNVDDTPNTQGTQGGCNLLQENCGSLDNINNHMEYTSCRNMFTQGQKDRMRAAIESDVAERNSLWQEENLIATGVFEEEEIVCKAEFTVDRKEVCTGDTISFFDESYHGITNWSWDFGDGTIIEGTDEEIHKNPRHAFSMPGVYTVTLSAGDGIDEVSEVKTEFIRVYDGAFLGIELIEGFEQDLDPDKWGQTNLDDDDVTWEQTSTTSWEGEECYRLRNRFVTIFDATDELITAPFGFSGQSEIVIRYRWAFALKTDPTDDRFKVSTSNDCGMTWTLREVHRGMTDLPTAPATDANFIPDGLEEWKEETIVIDNPDQITDNFRVKFEFNGRGGNNFFLDAINIGNETVLNITDLDLDQLINVYPNPTDQNFTIEFEGGVMNNPAIELFDVSGRLVYFEQISIRDTPSVQIERNNLSDGIYILSISDGQLTHRQQVILK